MKRIYYLLIIPIFVAIASCQDNFLTENNPTATTDAKWWTTDAELKSALGVIYTGIPSGGYDYQPNSYITFSGETDESVWNANFYGEVNVVAQGNATPDIPQETLGIPTNGILPIWKTDYSLIRDANRFLAHAGGAYDDSANVHRFLAEARALRAWYHLDLFLYYGGNIPLVTTAVSPDDAALKPAGEDQLIQFITTELDTCASLLPVSYPSSADRYRITKGACLTMEAWAFLNAHRYPEAAATAKRVIDMGQYQLYYDPSDSADSYFSLFQYTGSGNHEAILLDGYNHSFGRLAPASEGGPSNLSPTQAMVDSYETLQGKPLSELGQDSLKWYEEYANYNNNRDPRLAASILYPGEVFDNKLIDPFNQDPTNVNRLNATNSTVTGYWVRKYVDLRDRGNSSPTLDFMVFRYASVLLMYVEAQVESGNWQDPDVLKYINAIRHRAGLPDAVAADYNSQDKMRALYRQERRVEFAFEGTRLFDIRRWGIGKDVMNGPVYGATNPATGEAVRVNTRHYTDKNNLWPIPIQEITANSNMKQNPGY